MGTHVVGQGQAAAVGPVAGAPSTLPVHPVAKTPPISKQSPKKPAAKPPVVKRAPAKKASLAAINAAAAAAPVAGSGHTREVFNEMPERCVSIFLSGEVSLFAVNLIVSSFAVQPRGGLLRWHAQRCIHRH
jgi:septal ring-binding cell division protein DamX